MKWLNVLIQIYTVIPTAFKLSIHWHGGHEQMTNSLHVSMYAIYLYLTWSASAYMASNQIKYFIRMFYPRFAQAYLWWSKNYKKQNIRLMIWANTHLALVWIYTTQLCLTSTASKNTRIERHHITRYREVSKLSLCSVDHHNALKLANLSVSTPGPIYYASRTPLLVMAW